MKEPVLLGEGREAEVFLLPDGTVLKLMRDPEDADRVEREAAACAVLGPTGAACPFVVGVVTIDNRPGLVMQRVDGTDLLSLLQANPMRVFRAAGVLAATHVAIHEVQAPSALPEVHTQLRERIQRAGAVPDGIRDVALDVLDGLPRGDRLCHGDFHLGNLLGSWSDAVVIDWGYASRGDHVGDVAQSVLLHRVGAMPPGISALFKALATLGRGLLTRRYLSVYQRQRPFERALFDRWYFVHAAARLGEPVVEEHEDLLALVQRQVSSLR